MITQSEILQAAATIASGMYASKGYKGTQMVDIVDISTRCAYRMARILAECESVSTAEDSVKAKMEGPQHRTV